MSEAATLRERIRSTQPDPKRYYVHDRTRRVLCGPCLKELFGFWPTAAWTEVSVADQYEYSCDRPRVSV